MSEHFPMRELVEHVRRRPGMFSIANDNYAAHVAFFRGCQLSGYGDSMHAFQGAMSVQTGTTAIAWPQLVLRVAWPDDPSTRVLAVPRSPEDDRHAVATLLSCLDRFAATRRHDVPSAFMPLRELVEHVRRRPGMFIIADGNYAAHVAFFMGCLVGGYESLYGFQGAMSVQTGTTAIAWPQLVLRVAWPDDPSKWELAVPRSPEDDRHAVATLLSCLDRFAATSSPLCWPRSTARTSGRTRPTG